MRGLLVLSDRSVLVAFRSIALAIACRPGAGAARCGFAPHPAPRSPIGRPHYSARASQGRPAPLRLSNPYLGKNAFVFSWAYLVFLFFFCFFYLMADSTGFEPVTSTSVVWRSNPTELRVHGAASYQRLRKLSSLICIYFNKFGALTVRA